MYSRTQHIPGPGYTTTSAAPGPWNASPVSEGDADIETGVGPSQRLRSPITKLGHFCLGKGQVSREREPTDLLPLHCLLKADNYLNMPASFLPSRAFTSVIQQHVCEWKTSTALGTWAGTWGRQSCFPTPQLPVGIAAAGQCRCRAAGWGEGRMENAVTETNGGKARGGVSRLTVHLAGWRCKGDSNNSNSSIMG